MSTADKRWGPTLRESEDELLGTIHEAGQRHCFTFRHWSAEWWEMWFPDGTCSMPMTVSDAGRVVMALDAEGET